MTTHQVLTTGGRKFMLGLVYLTGCFIVLGIALAKGAEGWDAAALGVSFGGIATGLGTVIWGNAQEHRARTAAQEKA